MPFKKIAVAVALGLAAASPAMAQSMPDRGFYVGGSYGQATADDFCSELSSVFTTTSCDDKASAWKFFAGFQLNRNFAAEFTYMKTDDFSVGVGGTTASADATAFGIAALGILPISSQFSVFGKLGIISTEAEATASGPGGTATVGGDETGLHYGLGAMYHFTPRLGIRAEWEKADKGEFSVMSIGLQYRF